MFNIPFESEEIFNQCQDFCIEQNKDYGKSTKRNYINHSDAELQNRDKIIQDQNKKITSLQEGNKQFMLTIISLKQQISDFQAVQLTKEEGYLQLVTLN